MLEIHGVPFSRHENKNAIVLKIAEIIAPDLEIDEHEISTSHHLPTANSDFIPPIIVKFTRRDTRDRIYNSKRRLKSKKASDLGLGFTQDSKLYINESLTKKSKELLKKVKSHARAHNFKFIWTRFGKVFIRKDDSPISFTTVKEFADFSAHIQSC